MTYENALWGELMRTKELLRRTDISPQKRAANRRKARELREELGVNDGEFSLQIVWRGDAARRDQRPGSSVLKRINAALRGGTA